TFISYLTPFGSSPAVSQQPSLSPRHIGVLWPIGRVSAQETLRQAMSELGYVEGQNLTIEWRRYGQSDGATRSVAAEFVQARVHLIVALGTPAARAALSATSTIPVVFVSADPIGGGLATSLAQPGANATGISMQSTDLIAKRLDLLQQIVPRTRRI